MEREKLMDNVLLNLDRIILNADWTALKMFRNELRLFD